MGSDPILLAPPPPSPPLFLPGHSNSIRTKNRMPFCIDAFVYAARAAPPRRMPAENGKLNKVRSERGDRAKTRPEYIERNDIFDKVRIDTCILHARQGAAPRRVAPHRSLRRLTIHEHVSLIIARLDAYITFDTVIKFQKGRKVKGWDCARIIFHIVFDFLRSLPICNF